MNLQAKWNVFCPLYVFLFVFSLLADHVRHSRIDFEIRFGNGSLLSAVMAVESSDGVDRYSQKNFQCKNK